ncbi:MAG: hemolysin III family protein [Planctomycetaceae bacterium]|jgi:hemolysin III|nr:hemolysin III family protein [Planctomycetaceae bacterium]MBT6154302.1 hemolysin III family protein [Planctomycetaceae bacterium]MBT6485602.1 hemolysin III family protein [Planctomycetaceae bacterium]MBT6493585.1 hemolysin III family protein [Planctomycetaceae bacterium]
MQDSTDNFEREELANCVTHGVGVLLAMVGAVVLFRAVADTDNAALQASCWVYALGLIAVYAGSALSHSFKDESRRHFFRRLDQGIIFLFIAGNFTPLAITALQEPTRWIVLGVTWAIALVGFSTKVFWGYRVESTAVTHYLALGWLPITVVGPILESLPTEGILWSVAGGLCYTVGTVFLTFDTKVRYFHALWHLWVIAGSYCHFVVIVDYVI